MKSFLRRVAIVIGAAAVSAGLVGATATPAHADDDTTTVVNQSRDTGWGW